MSDTLNRWSGPASLIAGVLWSLIWLHQRATHGPTTVNEMHLLLGLTWMDSAKFLVVPLLLILIAGASLYQRLKEPGFSGRVGRIVTGVGLGFLIIGTALEFWQFPWGSYAVTFEEAELAQAGGLIQSLASLVFTLGLGMFSIALVRGNVVPIWISPVLILGALTTFFLTPVSWLPGLACLLLWLAHLRRDARGQAA